MTSAAIAQERVATAKRSAFARRRWGDGPVHIALAGDWNRGFDADHHRFLHELHAAPRDRKPGQPRVPARYVDVGELPNRLVGVALRSIHAEQLRADRDHHDCPGRLQRVGWLCIRNVRVPREGGCCSPW